MAEASLYDRDVYAWARHQAAVLRDLPRRIGPLPNDLDLIHVAEEIEDVGKSALRAVHAHLKWALAQAIKVASAPDCAAAPGWRLEILTHQSDAQFAVTPAMAKDLDLAKVWRSAVKTATRALAEHGDPVCALPDACPFDVRELVAEDVDLDALVARIAATATEPSAGSTPSSNGGPPGQAVGRQTGKT